VNLGVAQDNKLYRIRSIPTR